MGRTSAESLVHQVQRIVERQIISRTLGPGGRLPSSRLLAAQLGVSRSTVVAALDLLVAQGYVESRPRSGLFVNPDLLRIPTGSTNPADGAVSDRWDRLLPARQPYTRTGSEPSWWHAPYPFITGQSDPRMFPRSAWLRSLREAHDADHLVWSTAEHGGDDPLLAEQICGRIAAIRGVDCNPDQVLITLGSQHALSMIADVLTGPSTQAVVEDPGYPDARQILSSHGATVRAGRVDGAGLVVDDSLTGADLVYVTPSHQHPTNVTMSVERRIALLAAAETEDLTIVEDDYDSELRYHGAPSPALASLDRTGRAVYIGTFSKFIAPGLRVGFVVADARLIAAMRDRLRLTIRQVPGLIQRALGIFIRNGDYARALAAHRAELSKRWSLLQSSLENELGWTGTYPPGGTSLWMRAPDRIDWRDVAVHARVHGVLLQPPAEHWAAPQAPLRHVRLGFAAIPLRQIPDGIRELAAAYRIVVDE